MHAISHEAMHVNVRGVLGNLCTENLLIKKADRIMENIFDHFQLQNFMV
jgi:hypothetical protein